MTDQIHAVSNAWGTGGGKDIRDVSTLVDKLKEDPENIENI